ncbi:MAG: hypothetical protein ACP59X_05010 [Solidesulfovibrio sp. DCME]|uniref:hypothetical protein n=1 Tax=Solidesulfovibrio sp. DCME TaxID=3447380 RepID=UPI003D147C36
MGIIDLFATTVGKVGDAVTRSVEGILEWTSEPLKSFQHKRDLAREKLLHCNEVEKVKILADLESDRLKLIADLEIKKETEVNRINNEILQFTKDQDLQRQKDISDAIIHYQREYNTLVAEFISNISQLHIDLIDKAQDMIKRRLLDYKELQKEIRQEALTEYKDICASMGNDEFGKEFLISSLKRTVDDLLDTSSSIVKDLNDDLRRLKVMIERCATEGQVSIEMRLKSLQVDGVSFDPKKQLSST